MLGPALQVGRFAMQALPYLTAIGAAVPSLREGKPLEAVVQGGLGYLTGGAVKGGLTGLQGMASSGIGSPGFKAGLGGVQQQIGKQFGLGAQKAASLATAPGLLRSAAAVGIPLAGIAAIPAITGIGRATAGAVGGGVQQAGAGAANLAAKAFGYPQGYGQGATYNEAAINAGLTPSGYVDAYGNPLDIGSLLGTAEGRRMEYAKGIEQQRAAMQMLGPEIFKAKEAAARQELQRQLTAAGVRENIATQGAMLRQAQLGAQQVGAQAASQMGSALTQQYQYS